MGLIQRIRDRFARKDPARELHSFVLLLQEPRDLKARRRWSEFLQARRAGSGEHFAVKAPVTDVRTTEYIWIEDEDIHDDQILGTLANEPVDLRFLRVGDRLRTSLAELNDSVYVRNGEMVGGFTVKVLDEQARRR